MQNLPHRRDHFPWRSRHSRRWTRDGQQDMAAHAASERLLRKAARLTTNVELSLLQTEPSGRSARCSQKAEGFSWASRLGAGSPGSLSRKFSSRVSHRSGSAGDPSHEAHACPPGPWLCRARLALSLCLRGRLCGDCSRRSLGRSSKRLSWMAGSLA